MKIFVLVCITVATVFAAQDRDGSSALLNNLLGSVTDIVGKVTKDIVPKQLQAETLCACMLKAYEDKKYKACEGKAEAGLDVGELGKNIGDLLLECASIPIPDADLVTSTIAKIPLPELTINAKDRCECIYKEVKGDEIPACRGKQLINLVQAVTEVIKASQCKK